MGWSIERRLEFIDFRLFWEGRINRKDLTDFFGISIPQASADLKKYQDRAPDNLRYDRSGKFYYAGPQFEPIFTSSNSSFYLAQLRHIADKILREDETFLGQVPSFDTIPNIARVVDSEILRKMLYAINSKMSLEIKYQSMSRNQPIWRRVVPHTLAYDGFRWHFRAFCYERKMFRDFLFARVHEIRKLQSDNIDSTDDVLWHNFLELRIAPHPGLTETQKRIIERDYGMKKGIGTIKVRAALYFYLEKKLGLDEKCETRPPKIQQIVLTNRSEINKLRDRYSQTMEQQETSCNIRIRD